MTVEAVYPRIDNAFKLPMDEFVKRWNFARRWHPIDAEISELQRESEAWLKKQKKRRRE